MEDNVIKVSVRPNKQNSVKVSSNVASTPITANSDTSQLWSQISKNWAISENIVDNTDYSSKYYANKAKESASNAQGISDSVKDDYNEFLTASLNANEQLQTGKEEALTSLESARADAVDSINSTKTTILNDIEFVADGEKKEIEELAENAKDDIKSTGFYMEDDKLYFINSKGEVEEFKSGGTGLQMFDTILKDHILTYEESQGLALQGTYVYKEAVAGSRYGYPDFYNKVIKEFNEATSTETVNGVEIKVHSNGHKFYDISNKDSIDSFFNSMGYAWFYGVDTENERVFLPRNNWFEQATALESEVGKGIEAGLPNITGDTYTRVDNTSGCFKSAGTRNVFGTSTTVSAHSLAFDASRSSSVYGKSNTVQPKSVKKLLYICVGNTTNYTGMTDVVNQGMEILEQVSQKVNVDGTNLNAEGRSLISSYAFPSGKATNITAGASGTTYTAPANGWYLVAIQQTASSSCTLNLYTGGINLYHVHTGAQNGAWKSLYIPAKKGSNMILQYTGGSIVEFRFIYAEGEV